MARITTLAILILCLASAGCGGDCIRHSDCPAKTICAYGTCVDKGAAAEEEEDGGNITDDLGETEQFDTQSSSEYNGEETDTEGNEDTSEALDTQSTDVSDGDSDADTEGNTTTEEPMETDSVGNAEETETVDSLSDTGSEGSVDDGGADSEEDADGGIDPDGNSMVVYNATADTALTETTDASDNIGGDAGAEDAEPDSGTEGPTAFL